MSYHDRYEAYRYYAEANLLHKAYMETAKRILGEDIEVTIPGREKGFLAALKRFFKRK